MSHWLKETFCYTFQFVSVWNLFIPVISSFGLSQVSYTRRFDCHWERKVNKSIMYNKQSLVLTARDGLSFVWASEKKKGDKSIGLSHRE